MLTHVQSTLPGIAGAIVLAPVSRTPELNTLRVLHLVNGEHFSGAERVQLHLAHRLPEFAIQPDFVCLKPGKFSQQFDAPQSEVIEFPMRGRLDFRVIRSIAKLTRDDQYDLLHAHTPRSALVAAVVSRLTNTPWIYHVHSPAARDSASVWLNRFNDYAERLSLKNCRHQITVSNSLREELIRQAWPHDQVTAVHNGVPEYNGVSPRPPLDGNPWVLGMVALLRPRKGLEVMLDSLRCVINAGLNIRLRCIGPFETTEYETKIMARVSQLRLASHVEFTGFRTNIAEELSQLHALVLPSLFGEGLPMVVLEAMAAGLPVIATSVEGTPEAIRHGKEGLLAEPNSPGSLAAQLEALVRGDADWSELSRASKQRHRQSFSDRAMAQGVAAVYRRICAE